MKETCKILRAPTLPVSAFTVRVPTMNSHAEVVWVTMEKAPADVNEVEQTLKSAPGIEVMRHNDPRRYPTQTMASGTDPVYVGRIHRDLNDPNTFLLWIVADNLRKGAALNGLQIAERIFDTRVST